MKAIDELKKHISLARVDEREAVSDYVPEGEIVHMADVFKTLLTGLRKVERESEHDDAFSATMTEILKKAFEGKDAKRELEYLSDAIQAADVKTLTT